MTVFSIQHAWKWLHDIYIYVTASHNQVFSGSYFVQTCHLEIIVQVVCPDVLLYSLSGTHDELRESANRPNANAFQFVRIAVSLF